MKQLYRIFMVMIVLSGTLVACQEEGITSGEGKVSLSVFVNDNVQQLSRSTETDSLSKECTVYIYSASGLVRKFHGIDELPSELWLVSGDYTATAWAGDSLPASYTTKYYKGTTPFTISKEATATAKITCKIANTVASVAFDSSVDGVLKDYKVTVGHSGGSLDFSRENEDAKGYYMMPAGVTDLVWTLTGTTLSGSPYTQTGTIAGAKSATEYTIKLSHNDNSTEYGGAMFNVVIDETSLVMEDNVQLTAAPKITGSGFDITQPIYSEKGLFSKMAVYAVAACNLESVTMSCPQFAALGFGNTSFDFLSMTDEAAAEVAALGISHSYSYDATADTGIMKISLGTDFLNRLPDGSYPITITATDAKGKIRTQVLDIEVSDASVMTTDINVEDVYSTTAVVRGTITKADAANFVFKYRKTGTVAWTTVAATVSGNSFSAKLTDLTPGTAYQFCAACDGFDATVKSFTTEVQLQLSNNGFEIWGTDSSDGSAAPYGSSDAIFWDTGNHGSFTLSINVTTADASIKHSGNYSAKMQSQFVGVFGFGKFAAGNIFVGKYLKTDGSDGVLGFGRAFTSRPKSLTGYVKYSPGSVNYTGASGVSSGDTDKGVIYVALLDNTTMSYNGSAWPQVIKTASPKQLFDSSTGNPAVIAYGELTLSSATVNDAGESMTKFTINLDYRDSRVPTYILLVASASKYGDYFTGSDSSVMWIDDFILNY